MIFKRLSKIEATILVDYLFRPWVETALTTGVGGGLVVEGRLSPQKHWVALWQAITPPLTLEEVGRESQTGTSRGVIATWRLEKDFRALADTAAKAFADHMAKEIVKATWGGDDIRCLILTSLWVRLPGFDVVNNPLMQEITQAANELRKNLTKRRLMRLYNFLATFRDALRFSHENLKPARCQEIERQALEAVSPELEPFEAKVKKAEAAGLIDETLATGLLNMIVSIEFLCSYSKVVV
jgi:hypothetical protein